MIPALGRQSQEDLEFKASLGYTIGLDLLALIVKLGITWEESLCLYEGPLTLGWPLGISLWGSLS